MQCIAQALRVCSFLLNPTLSPTRCHWQPEETCALRITISSLLSALTWKHPCPYQGNCCQIPGRPWSENIKSSCGSKCRRNHQQQEKRTNPFQVSSDIVFQSLGGRHCTECMTTQTPIVVSTMHLPLFCSSHNHCAYKCTSRIHDLTLNFGC